MPARKKQQLITVGSTVRVADPDRTGQDRWLDAALGIVLETWNGGCRVKVDGQERRLLWSDVDVVQKPRPKTVEIPLLSVVPSRWQPRQSSFDVEELGGLAESIRQHGLLSPVLVFINEDQEYELVAGERRIRACVANAWADTGLVNPKHAWEWSAEHRWMDLAADIQDRLSNTTITARILPADDYQQLHELALIDNIQRQDLTPIEKAHALQGLIEEYGYSQRDLASHLGWSQPRISQCLGLLGLAGEVQEALITRVITPTHARAIATLPRPIQAAVTGHVQQLLNREGDQATTTRKVQNMVAQLRRFLDPDRWLPPADQVIQPTIRNRLRLMRHLLSTTDLSQVGDRILAMRHDDNSTYDNLIGKSPLNLAEYVYDFDKILDALETTGRVRGWPTIAPQQGWTCGACQLNRQDLDITPWVGSIQSPCDRWLDNKCETCLNYIGLDDPLIIPLPFDMADWLEKQEDNPMVEEPFHHLTGVADFLRLAALYADHNRQYKVQMDQQKQQAHLLPLLQYWQAQQPGQLLDTLHFQAHRCDRCDYYRPELLEALPPCLFAVEPLTNKYADAKMAPDMGILIREDGLMVPRCYHFRFAHLPYILLPLEGFRLPDHDIALAWLHSICAIAARGYGHSGTLPGILAWLPYPRSQDKVHDLDALERYIKNNWENLGGDEIIARLMFLAAIEARARASYQDPITLHNPAVTGLDEKWVAITWRTFTKGEKPACRYDYPANWPTPWVRDEP